jgi:hypothetical protein
MQQLIDAAAAVLTMLESEGRDTGAGGPLSDLRDEIDHARTNTIAPPATTDTVQAARPLPADCGRPHPQPFCLCRVCYAARGNKGPRKWNNPRK